MYDNIAQELFEHIDMTEFPQFPRFGSGCKFERLLKTQDEKQQHKQHNLLHSSQRILLILAIEHDSLKYCPQLGYLVEEMLLDSNSSETGVFSICHSMLVASKRNNWYFRTDYFNSYVRIKTFLSIFEHNVSFVASHLKNNNMDISNIMGDAISSMWFEYVSNETYLRLIDTFSVEGYKILFRVGVALLNHAQSQLVLCNDLKLFKNVLIAESKKLYPNELCLRCFKIYLTRNKFEKLDKFHRDKGFDDPFLNNVEEETYVRRWPSWNKNIMDKSAILSKKVQFLQLWVWLPPGCHIGDYELLFSTANDGYKLSQLYLQCQEQENLIIIIKTVQKEIIGVFVSQFDDPVLGKFAPLKKRIKDPKILLFQLHSNCSEKGVNVESDENKNDRFEAKCFWADTVDQFYHRSKLQMENMHTQRGGLDMNDVENDLVEIVQEEKKNDDKDQRIPVVFPSKEALIIGDGHDNCIYLDEDLNYGFSSKCVTFNSPSLVIAKDGQFQVSHVEVWSVK